MGGGSYQRWPRLPAARDGLRIGLLGGSFNPPHEGHLHISELALNRLGLDRVWWLVTPGNPLKDHAELAPLEERIKLAATFGRHPRIDVTGVEADIGISRTLDTLRFLKNRCRTTRFVWLMGGDNLAGFHHWHRYQDICEEVPICIVDRPGASLTPLSAPMASRYRAMRCGPEIVKQLPDLLPPAWFYLHGPLSPLSSTALRAARQKGFTALS